LIDYLALSDEPSERAGNPPKPVWKHVLRPRTILYTAIWASIGLGMLYALFIRSDIELTVSPVRNPTYVLQPDGAVRNIYDVRLRNKSGQDRVFRLSLTSDEILRINLEGSGGQLRVNVPADKTVLQRVYITLRKPRQQSHNLQRETQMITEIKGWHVLAGFCTAFGIIIAVNLTLAFNAVRTFPGLEVANSYVASQSFDKNRQAQIALGWDVSATLNGNELSLFILKEGVAISPKIESATFGRATHVTQDQTPEFKFDGKALRATVQGGAGNWNLRLKAHSDNGTLFEQRVIVEIGS